MLIRVYKFVDAHRLRENVVQPEFYIYTHSLKKLKYQTNVLEIDL